MLLVCLTNKYPSSVPARGTELFKDILGTRFEAAAVYDDGLLWPARLKMLVVLFVTSNSSGFVATLLTFEVKTAFGRNSSNFW